MNTQSHPTANSQHEVDIHELHLISDEKCTVRVCTPPNAHEPTGEYILSLAGERGIKRSPLSTEVIQRSALLAMVKEAALLLTEGVAQRAGDIDVVLVNGYGFPAWVGGPVHWACSQPRSSLEQELGELTAASGFGAVRATSAMLDRLLD